MIRSHDVRVLPVTRFLPEILLILLSLSSVLPHLTSFFTSDDFLLLERARDSEFFNLPSPYLDIPVGVFFRPVASLSYAAVFQIARYEPLFYHLLSFVLHALNCILFYRLLLLLQEQFRRKMLSLAAASISAVHPRTQETIATIYCLPDLLVVAFSLLTLILIARYFVRPDRRFIVCSLLTFLLALGSKENALIVLPLLLLACYVFGADKLSKQNHSKWIVPAMWFGVLTLAFLALRGFSVGSLSLPSSEYANYSASHLGLFIAKGIAAYLLPISLMSFLTKSGAVVFLGIVAVAVIVLMARNRKKVEFKIALALTIVAVVLLAPASMYSFSLTTGQENRFLYFSIFPLSACVVSILSMVLASKRVLQSVLAVLVAVLLTLTHLESGAWTAAAQYAGSILKSYAGIVDDHDDQNIVLLDGLMYIGGATVGITPAALRLSPFLTGENQEIMVNQRVLTFLYLEVQDPEPAVAWILEGDILVGQSLTGKPIFLGPKTALGERSYFHSTPGLTIEAFDFDSRTNLARRVAIFPFSWFNENTMFVTTAGRTLRKLRFNVQGN